MTSICHEQQVSANPGTKHYLNPKHHNVGMPSVRNEATNTGVTSTTYWSQLLNHSNIKDNSMINRRVSLVY